jgi:hypothetical protein
MKDNEKKKKFKCPINLTNSGDLLNFASLPWALLHDIAEQHRQNRIFNKFDLINLSA